MKFKTIVLNFLQNNSTDIDFFFIFRRCDNIIKFLRQIIVFNETNSVEAY